MDINYYRKINGSYGKTQKETIISQIQQNYDKNYENTLSTFEILKNTKRADTVYINLDKTNTTNVVFDYNTLKKTKQDIIPMEQKDMWVGSNLVKRGDYISYTNSNSGLEEIYLIVGKVEAKRGYDDCIITECNGVINFMKDNKVCSYPSIITNQTLYTLGVTIGTLKEGSSKYSIVLPYNEDTKIIQNDMRFIIGGKKGLIVSNVDYSTQEGLLSLLCGECEVNSVVDDLVNNIADRWKSSSKYTIEINSTNISLTEGETYQLATIIKKDGVVVPSPSITYSSSDNTIATVSNTGLITCIKEGNTTISCKFVDSLSNEYTTISNVVVSKPVVVNNYTMDWSYGGTVGYNIKKYQSAIYYPHLYNNGVEVSNVQWNFVVNSYVLPATNTNTSIVETTSNYIKIKNISSTGGSIQITATDINNASNTITKTITFST